MLKKDCLIIDASTSFRKDGKRPFGDVDPAARALAAAFTLETGGVGPATVTKLVHQGWRGMLYQNTESVREALKDNEAVVKSVFTDLLVSYARSSETDAKNNAEALYNRAIDKNSHSVHAVDALEAIMPSLMK
jgi:adenylosuccinate synthase